MQGYIIRLQRVRNEDLILSILTESRLETVYRFYGARHSTVNLGYKIDFEIEHSLKSSVGRLYDVVHLAYPWMRDPSRARLWHRFVTLFHPHLRDAEETGGFYFGLLDRCADLWGRQNPKRVAVEAYVRLLKHEGRLPVHERCFFCEAPITAPQTAVIRSFYCAHQECSHSRTISRTGLDELFRNGSTLFLENDEVDTLWMTLLEGL